MTTQSQIDANRRNSRKSTGPRSAECKAASRFNALKTGIYAQSQVIPGEDPADLETLTAEYRDEYQPDTPQERDLVDSLIYATWQLRRLRRVEAQLWRSRIMDAQKKVYSKLNESAPLGDIFERDANSFILAGRRLDAADRAYYRALHELQRIQKADEPEPDPPAEPDSQSEPCAQPEPCPQVLEDKPHLASFPNIPPAPAVEPPCSDSRRSQ